MTMRTTIQTSEGSRAARAFAFTGLVVLVVLLTAAPTFALSLAPGSEYHIKLTDATVPFHSVASPTDLGTPVAKVAGVVTGDVLRGIANITSLESPAGSTVSTGEFNPLIEELTSVFYDLRVSRVTQVSSTSTMKIVEIGFVPAQLFGFVDTAVGAGGTAATAVAGFGGHLDFYREELGNAVDTRYTTALGSSAFVAGGSAATAARPNGGDAYPRINTTADTDDALVLEAVFAPLPTGAPCYACLPGVEVLNITFGFRTSNGSIIATYSRGFGFVNFIGGPLADAIREGGIPESTLAGLAPGMTAAGAKAAGYDASLEIGYRPPTSVLTGATAWMASSEDPIHLSTNGSTAVPAPPAVLLLGLAILMLGQLKREWRTTMLTLGRFAVMATITVFGLLPATAHALTLNASSSYHVKLGDHTGAFRDASGTQVGTPITSVGALLEGDILRGISQLTSIQYHGTNTPVPGTQFNPTTTEITGLFYDLRLARITLVSSTASATTFELGFVPGTIFSFNDTAVPTGATAATAAGGFGGHYDMFRELKGNGTDTLYTGAGGTSSFIAGGGAVTAAKPQGGDAYPGLNTAADTDDSILLETVFARLPETIGCFACTPDEVMLITFTVNSAGVIGTGSGVGFLNVIGGSLAPSVLDGGIPADVLEGYGLTAADARQLGLDISLELSFGAPTAAASTSWLASSEDPMHFTTTAVTTPVNGTVPAPTTAALVLVGSIALVGRSFARRS